MFISQILKLNQRERKLPLFDIANGIASRLDSTTLGKEKEIQEIFEGNLATLLNIDFVKSEHVTSAGGRIDTLGIDRNGSPVIIEYKKTQNDNVINQGLSYLKWLLDHKAEFQDLCHKSNISTTIEWDSPRLICVAENYNKFDLDTAEFLHIKIELLRYTIYNSKLLYIDKDSQLPVRISTSRIFEKGKKVKEEREHLQKDYSIDDHLSKTTEAIKQIFLKLRERIMGLDDSIVEEPKKKYIAYKLATNFVDVVLQRGSLKLYLNMPSGKLDDPSGLARDLEKPTHHGHWGNGDYEVNIKEQKDMDNAFELIKQSYSHNK